MNDFYRNKKILITGNTGFKGTWLTKILLHFGADVAGYSLEPPTEPNLFELSGVTQCKSRFTNLKGDVRDLQHVMHTFESYKPDIVFHLAAQPIVLESYVHPVYTYETNVMGTVNVLECIRKTDSVKSAVIITTDKVYKNNEWVWGYRENEQLDGYDPYSNSKSCAELAVHSYVRSYFSKMDGKDSHRYLAVSTARAGNVIGGGDFAENRVIPDCVRAIESACRNNEDGVIPIRNPYSTRPYQHVLEPLIAYLMIAEKQWNDKSVSGCYNVGPDDNDCMTTGDLVSLFCNKWNDQAENLPHIFWNGNIDNEEFHEASFLKLDSTLIKRKIGYSPTWNIYKCMDETVRFVKRYMTDRTHVSDEMEEEITEFMRGRNK